MTGGGALARATAWFVRPRRARTPTVLQMEAVECGAACLGMVLGFHKLFVPLEVLRYECGVSRDGSSASKLVQAARRFGMNAKGLRMEPKDLAKAPLPAVVFWNFNHFIVVEGMHRDRVYINDPALGPRTLSAAEFDEGFTGVVLLFQPGPRFHPAGRRPDAWRSLGRRLRPAAAGFAFVALASLLQVVPGIATAGFSRLYADFVLIEEQQAWLWPLTGAMVVAGLFAAALTLLHQNGLLALRNRLSTGWAARFVWHSLRLPVSFFAQRSPAETGNRILVNDAVAELVAGPLASVLFNLVSVVIYGGLMLAYDARLTAVVVGFSALNLLVFTLVTRRLADESQRLAREHGQLAGMVMHGLRMIESYKASGQESQFFARFAGSHAKAVDAEQRLERLRIVMTALPPFLGLLAAAAVLVLGGLRVMDGALTIGMLVAFQALMNNLSEPMVAVVGVQSDVQTAWGMLTRLDDTLRHPVDAEFTRPEPAGPVAAKLGWNQEIRGLTFGYNPLAPPLIEGFDLDLRPGARVALVGGSGSGKSTVGKLLAGLYEPWSGDIRMDGRLLSEIPRAVLRNSVAMVDQSVTLFEGSVTDNITLWDRSIPHERVVAAAKDADIHDDVSRRPGSYAAPVEEGGRNFSGGQRQRIEIARALVGDPCLLILDEATSALDTASERRIVENLRRRGCSCLIIAHRLSTIHDADEIVVMERGRIVQRGTHDALKDIDGPYRTLIAG